MREIDVAPSFIALVDDEDYEYLNKFSWYNSQGYARAENPKWNTIYPYRKKIRMHRVIMNPPKDKLIDHINGNTLDNRKINLRICTKAENQWSHRKRTRNAKYRGVNYNKIRNTWRAIILKNSKPYYVDGFKTEHHAALARDLWAIDLHGEFAHTNFLKAI